MSQSPDDATNPNPGADYFRSWDSLGMMLSRGQSFSGVERDCVFLNTGSGRFANISAVTGLDLIDDGRGMAICDWDRDGRIDLWVGNRTGPRVRLMRNAMDAGNGFITLHLEGVNCNRDAIGTRVELVLAGGKERKLLRTLRAGDGYLSQSSKMLHFGLEKGETVSQMTVRWPDGMEQEFKDVPANRHLRLQQGRNLAVHDAPTPGAPLAASVPKTPAPTSQARVAFTMRRPLPTLAFREGSGATGTLADFAGQPLLVNLWASWCPPCREELIEWKAQAKELEAAGWKVVLACTDRVGDAPSEDFAAAREFVKENELPFLVVEVDTEFVRGLNLLHNQSLYKERSLPLPTTFAIDRDGKMATAYRGPVSAKTLIDDAWLGESAGDPDALLARALPFKGEFLYRKLDINPITWAKAYSDSGYYQEARQELSNWLSSTPVETRAELADLQPRDVLRASVLGELAQVELRLENRAAAADAAKEMMKLAPREPQAHLIAAGVLGAAGDVALARQAVESAIALAPENPRVQHEAARILMAWGDVEPAVARLQRGLELRPGDQAMQLDLATIYQLQRKFPEAIAAYRRLLAESPDSLDAANNLAWLYATNPDDQVRDGGEAVRLAESACEGTGRQVAAYLGTLAAAYAEAARFDDAVATTQEALALATSSGQLGLAQHLAARQAEYRQKRPFRDGGRN